MIYLDTDFVIHYLVNQDKDTHSFVTKRLKRLLENDKAVISILTLQEVAFVLSKLKYDNFEIMEKIGELEDLSPINFSIKEFNRAKDLALKVGFDCINDCLHTAIAEANCQVLYTFNKKDFERIKQYTSLEISIF